MNVEAPHRRSAGPVPGGDDPRSVVALPNPGLPGVVLAGVAAVLAIVLFLILNGQRTHPGPEASPGETQLGTFASPPPLVLPPEPAPAPMPQPMISIPVQPLPAPVDQPKVALAPAVFTPTASPQPMTMTTAMPEQAPAQPAPGFTEPALIYDAGAPVSEPDRSDAIPSPEANQPAAAQQRGAASAPPSTARLTKIENPTTVVPTGTLIRATLETPIDTSRPGFARALVSRDARGFDGRRVLIPRGSRLIGEYGSDVRMGQNRVLVTWTQLLRPDGSVIRLESPAADGLGGAGVPGRLHSYFLERFSNAILQTALSVGGSLAAYSSNAPVVIGLPGAAVTNVAGQVPLLGQVPEPKITVKQGTAFSIFVARDLDFSGAPSRPQAGANDR